VERWREEFGPGGVIEEAGPVYPCLPVYCLTEGSLEEALPVGEYVDLPVPVDPRDVPHSLQRITDTMGDNYVVDPETDLVTLCANCHAMVHRQDPPLSVEELSKIVKY
jgi:hypothetical protein